MHFLSGGFGKPQSRTYAWEGDLGGWGPGMFRIASLRLHLQAALCDALNYNSVHAVKRSPTPNPERLEPTTPSKTPLAVRSCGPRLLRTRAVSLEGHLWVVHNSAWDWEETAAVGPLPHPEPWKEVLEDEGSSS